MLKKPNINLQRYLTFLRETNNSLIHNLKLLIYVKVGGGLSQPPMFC